jgi:hypothetical protein
MLQCSITNLNVCDFSVPVVSLLKSVLSRFRLGLTFRQQDLAPLSSAFARDLDFLCNSTVPFILSLQALSMLVKECLLSKSHPNHLEP